MVLPKLLLSSPPVRDTIHLRTCIYFRWILGGLSWKNRRLGCVGIALPEVDVQIVDPESLEVLPNDTDGEVSQIIL
jgi:hypothetical protein